MKIILIILTAFLCMAYLPSTRHEEGKIYEQSDLVVLAKAEKIIFKDKIHDVVDSDLKVKVRYFYATFKIIHIYKGEYKEKVLELYVGRARSGDLYKSATTHNTQPRYFVEPNETYLLELINTKEGYKPIAYWDSILKIKLKSEISFESFYREKKEILTLKEYEKSRNIELKKIKEILTKESTEFVPNR